MRTTSNVPPTFNVYVTCVRSVAQHQAHAMPEIVSEEDRSGLYVLLNPRTLYCEATAQFLHLSAEGLEKVKAGLPVRVSPAAFS
jgi:hypothetical protein